MKKNKFNLNTLSLKVVIQYSLDIDITLEGRVIDYNGQYQKKGELITAFIQNQKFRLDDIANFKQICPETKFWGGRPLILIF